MRAPPSCSGTTATRSRKWACKCATSLFDGGGHEDLRTWSSLGIASKRLLSVTGHHRWSYGDDPGAVM
jgi:hypothetical protein